mmetsp:Transcript_7148/g.14336  ORF Transcript_7148/g.14336 Transcript_7148/m.14336 type:complete len:185 (+) Transcript_7148:1-555(+)
MQVSIEMVAHSEPVRMGLLRRTFELAREAEAAGEAPFGALVVDLHGNVVAEGQNAIEANNDPSAHAESLALRAAHKSMGAASLAKCHLYSSTEPCAMCCALAFWTGVCSITFGAEASVISEHAVKPGFVDREHPHAGGAPAGSARAVFCGKTAEGVERMVSGPHLVDEAREVHDRYWVPVSSET